MKPPSSNEVRKPTKTISGVTPVAVMLPPRKCRHGTCLYCPSLNMPQSYTPKSPAVMRALSLGYDAYRQAEARIQAFRMMHHPTDKIELIIMGGTFLSYPVKFQHSFIKGCYDALNGKKSRNLKEAKKLNEKTRHRCVALCIETRPDVCSKQDIKRMLKFGCTRVELGVQAIDDEIYRIVKRGHKVKDVIEATQRLKDSGFKVGNHIMPGLPGSNIKKDLRMFKQLFSDERFKPDQLKIYPCQVIKGSGLERLYWKNKYKPYAEKEIKKIIIRMLEAVPEYCRVMRIMREIHPDYLAAGTTRIDLRKDIEYEIRKKGIKLNEIRFREIGFAKTEDYDIKIKKTEYNASKGKEVFLQAVNKENILFGLLRLRFPCKPFIKELKNCAIIRELHVYGKAEKLGVKGKIQHTGIGRALIKMAEEIAKRNRAKKLFVIAGVGVRPYFYKLGYKQDGFYVSKEL
ncbi:MAG TPA: tRNA uridine(34) 5-carboxymethylaminomethyl modification radical SAM/GNAT enzyme Elp3 [Candidatus Nanoarchaeia archaeon]|nr:tRNA uridine(34) 5-carboxymethylaminomethyl modification radical SAM/GNAT enzyme Elp3 [Candidatus Nanoarchaeia archaeon]